jgi:hypothetical protein
LDSDWIPLPSSAAINVCNSAPLSGSEDVYGQRRPVDQATVPNVLARRISVR